jgi:hypothetical protein
VKDIMRHERGAPKILDGATFQTESDALRVREEAHTRAGDAIAAAPGGHPRTEMISNMTVSIDRDVTPGQERLKASPDHWLSLAATPTFAFMAALTAILGGGGHEMLCSAATAQWNDPDVLADGRLPFGALAEARLQMAKRCLPILIQRSPDRAATARSQRPTSTTLAEWAGER